MLRSCYKHRGPAQAVMPREDLEVRAFALSGGPPRRNSFRHFKDESPAAFRATPPKSRRSAYGHLQTSWRAVGPFDVELRQAKQRAPGRLPREAGRGCPL